MSRCTVEHKSGRFCDAPAASWSPFPICTTHALELFRVMDDRLAASQSDEMLRLTVGARSVVEMRARAERRRPLVAEPAEAEHVVYYLLVDGLIKIGHTSNVESRMRAYPPTAQLLATEPGTRFLEAERHRQFSRHLTSGREWFTPAPELRAHIEGLSDYNAA